MRERRRNYELVFMISPLQADEENVKATIERVSQSIEKEGGEVSAVNHSAPWGRRKLAYPIREYAGGEASRRNFTEGFYVLLHFTLSAANIGEVERTLKLSASVLRYLITLVDKKHNNLAAELEGDSANESDEEEVFEESDD